MRHHRNQHLKLFMFNHRNITIKNTLIEQDLRQLKIIAYLAEFLYIEYVSKLYCI